MIFTNVKTIIITLNGVNGQLRFLDLKNDKTNSNNDRSLFFWKNEIKYSNHVQMNYEILRSYTFIKDTRM